MPRYTEDELLTMLQEFAAENGSTPRVADFRQDPDMPWPGTYKNRFGSWNAALREAGLTPNKEQQSYSEAELLELLREFAEHSDRDGAPVREEVNWNRDMPSAITYRERFGSWNDALRAAGFTINKEHPPRTTEEELLTQLQEYVEHREEDGAPTYREVRTAPVLPSVSTYIAYFGSWTDALRAAGFTPKTDASSDCD